MKSSSPVRALLPYAITLLVTAAVLAAAAVPVVARSDWWNTHASVASATPRQLAPGPLPTNVRARWSQPGQPDQDQDAQPASTAIPPTPATQVTDSTVIVSGRHHLAGRDPRSGEERWRYERANATLCGWTVVDHTLVVAAFRHDGGCTDVTALDAGTGQRSWYRNVDVGDVGDNGDRDDSGNSGRGDDDGGHTTLAAAPGTVIVGGPTKVMALYSNSGVERWAYTRAGCRFGAPTTGDLGVVLVLTCRQGARMLALHDLATKDERWSVPVSGDRLRVLTATGGRIVLSGSYQNSTALMFYDERGALRGSLTGPESSAAPAAAAQGVVAQSMLLTWSGSQLIGIDMTRAAVAWSAPARGPAVVDATGAAVYADGAGLVEASPVDGKVLQRIRVDGGPSLLGARLARIGAAVVASGPAGTTVYG